MSHPHGIEYTIRRSERARRVRVTVDAARGVEVVLPRRAPERAAAAAVAELRSWIERRVEEAARVRAVVAARGETVPLLGQPIRLVPEPGRLRVHLRGSELLVPAEDPRGDPLARWYRRTAREEIALRLNRACALAGRSYSKLTIREQRTRWASCSRTGAMSFNWRLILAPAPVLDYVVWHEVCHLDVHDHSRRFWALLETRCPAWREQVRWLRRYGATLVL